MFAAAATLTEVLLKATFLLLCTENNLELVLVWRQVTATSIETEAAQRSVGPLLVDSGKNPQLLLDDVG